MNKEETKEYNKQYRKKNKISLAIKDREKHKANKQKRNEYARQYYKDNKEKLKDISNKWHTDNPEKAMAHYTVNNAVRRGELQSIKELICIDCNNQAKEYHHEDYNQYLNVIPLCINCHRLRHSKEVKKCKD